jgi:hypothetical protein
MQNFLAGFDLKTNNGDDKLMTQMIGWNLYVVTFYRTYLHIKNLPRMNCGCHAIPFSYPNLIYFWWHCLFIAIFSLVDKLMETHQGETY